MIMDATKLTVAVFALSLVVVPSWAGCSSSSTDGTDGGALGSDGGGGGGGDGGGNGDGGAVDGGDSTCTFATVGHPGATPIQPKTIADPGPEGPGGVGVCDASDRLMTKAQYQAYLASKNDGGAGGSDAGVDVDDATEEVLVVKSLSNVATAIGIDSGAIILLSSPICQGVAPQCEETAYVVPKASGVTRVACPPPKEPCLAP